MSVLQKCIRLQNWNTFAKVCRKRVKARLSSKPEAYRVAKSPLRLDYVTQALIWCISIGYTNNKELKGDIYDC